jgi:hypothetical protein
VSDIYRASSNRKARIVIARWATASGAGVVPELVGAIVGRALAPV